MLAIRCPECDDNWMRYTSDRSGNVRRYVCKCGVKWLATFKGLKCGSVMSEPKNCDMEDFHWVKILE